MHSMWNHHREIQHSRESSHFYYLDSLRAGSYQVYYFQFKDEKEREKERGREKREKERGRARSLFKVTQLISRRAGIRIVVSGLLI